MVLCITSSSSANPLWKKYCIVSMEMEIPRPVPIISTTCHPFFHLPSNIFPVAALPVFNWYVLELWAWSISLGGLSACNIRRRRSKAQMLESSHCKHSSPWSLLDEAVLKKERFIYVFYGDLILAGCSRERITSSSFYVQPSCRPRLRVSVPGSLW